MADEQAERDPLVPELEVRQGTTPPCAELYLETFDEVEAGVGDFRYRARPRDRWVLVAKATGTEMTVFPLSVNPFSQCYLSPKMGRIRSITFPIQEMKRIPSTLRQFEDALESTPTGMIRKAIWGFGFVKELRVVWQTLATIEKIESIVLVDGVKIAVSDKTLYLGMLLFDRVRKDVEAIWSRYKSEAREDKALAAHNRLLHAFDPVKFPLATKRLRPGKIFETIKLSDRSPAQKKDIAAALNYVRSKAQAAAVGSPSELLELRAEIERVTVVELEKKFSEMISRKLSESSWQDFFKTNAFILSLLFSHPVFLIQDQAYVGGQGVNRRGARIADFLLAHGLAGSLAIVEIKKPDTEVLLSSPYRGNDIFCPTTELTGAVSQVLSQKYEITKNISSIKEDSEILRGTTAECLRCIVLIGRVPVDQRKKRSFNLYRNSCKDVEVVTFDELHEKLRLICELLKGEISPSASAIVETSGLTDIPF